MANQEQRINIKASDDDLKGRHTNLMQVSHTKEEFLLDFFLVQPPIGQMVGRIITSPGHMKRIAAAIEKNIELYEEKFGTIEESEAPEANIGFGGNK